MGAGTVQYTVAVSEDRLVLLDLVAEMASRQERDWLAEQRLDHLGLRGTRLADARRATREALAAKRASGELAGSRDWLLVPGVKAELEARGWDKRRWKPIPTGALARGRRWGTDPRRYAGQHDAGENKFLGRLGVRLPQDLGERLQQAVYWSNAKIERQLQEWADTWGDGPEVILKESVRAHGGVTALSAMVAALASTPSEGELARRTQLRGQVVTTGDVIRAALDRALAEAPERARREHTRLSRAAKKAADSADYAAERKAEAEEKQKLAEQAGLTEDAERYQRDALGWSTRARFDRLDAQHLAEQADSVATLLQLLAAREEEAAHPEQLALPEG